MGGKITLLVGGMTPQPMDIRSIHQNLVMDALTSPNLAMLACRLFSSNELPIIGIMLNRDCKA